MALTYTDQNEKIVVRAEGRFQAVVDAAVKAGDLLAFLNTGSTNAVQLADQSTSVPAQAIALENGAAGNTIWCAETAELKAHTTQGVGGLVTQTYFAASSDFLGSSLYLGESGKPSSSVGGTYGQAVGYVLTRERILLTVSPVVQGLLDNVMAVFGTGKDAFLYYDGTNLIIKPAVVGSGQLVVYAAIDLITGNAYKINNTSVLSATALGSGVLASSLTSVGTITTGVWTGTDVAVADGGTGAGTAAAARTNLGVGMVHEGSQTTEATTTSTSAVDLLTVTSLTIAAASPIYFAVSFRKTAGAANGVRAGFKLNSTEIRSPVPVTGTTDAAMAGIYHAWLGARVTNYLRSGRYRSEDQDGSTTEGGLVTNMPTADITDVILRGLAIDAAITMGATEMHVYSYAAS
jgi:hypothetical protein